MDKFASLALFFFAALLLAGIAFSASQGDFGARNVVGSLMLPGALIFTGVCIWERDGR